MSLPDYENTYGLPEQRKKDSRFGAELIVGLLVVSGIVVDGMMIFSNTELYLKLIGLAATIGLYRAAVILKYRN